MTNDERLVTLLKTLYRAQFTVLESYKKLAEDDRLTDEDKEDINVIMNDHEMHKDRLGKLIEDMGEKTPDISGKIMKWGTDLKEAFDGDDELYMTFQMNLSGERLLIDLYDIAAIFAHDNEKVLLVLDQNSDQDVEHADFFKDGTLGFAEELYEGEDEEPEE